MRQLVRIRATRDWLPFRAAKDDNAHVFVKRRRLLDGIVDMMPEEEKCEAVVALADEGLNYVEIARRLKMTEIDVWIIALDACTDEQGNVRWRCE